MKKLNKKGFTIVELVIVIAVIAILAAVLIPTFSGVVEKANESAAEQNAQSALKIALTAQKDVTLDAGTIIMVGESTAAKYYKYENGILTKQNTAPATTSLEAFTHGDANAYTKSSSSGTLKDLPFGVTVYMSESDAKNIG